MAGILPGILQGLQTSLAQLAKSSELQTETLRNLREDLILRLDDEEIDDISDGNNLTGGNTLDVESAANDVLGSDDCERGDLGLAVPKISLSGFSFPASSRTLISGIVSLDKFGGQTGEGYHRWQDARYSPGARSRNR